MYAFVSLMCAFDPGPEEEYRTTSNISRIWSKYWHIQLYSHLVMIAGPMYLLPVASWSQYRRMNASSPYAHTMPLLPLNNSAHHKIGRAPQRVEDDML